MQGIKSEPSCSDGSARSHLQVSGGRTDVPSLRGCEETWRIRGRCLRTGDAADQKTQNLHSCKMQPADAVKVVVLGSSYVGKTSLLLRFANDSFQESRAPSTTVGAGFFIKNVMVGTEKVKLQIWDTAGSEKYNSITRMYYRKAQAAILCYDITNHGSFVDVQFWAQEVMKYEPECRLYLCGCKLDHDSRQVSPEQARHFAQGNCAAFFETSATTGENVVTLFNKICLDAVNWSFVSITTGHVTEKKEAPDRTNHGAKKSFNLQSTKDSHEDSGCFGRICRTA